MSRLPTTPLPTGQYAQDFQQARAKLLLQTLVGSLAVGGAAGVALPWLTKATTNPVPVPEDLPGADIVQIGQVGQPKKKQPPALNYKQAGAPPAGTPAPATSVLDPLASAIAPAMPVENTAPGRGFYGPAMMAAVGIPAAYFGVHGGLALNRHFEAQRRKTELQDEEAKFDAARRLMYEQGRGIKKLANDEDVAAISARVLDDNDPLNKIYERHKQADWPTLTSVFSPGAAQAEKTWLGGGSGAGGGGIDDPSLRTMAGLGLLAFGVGGAAGALHGATTTSPSTFEDLQKRILKRRLGVRDTKTYTPFTSTYVAPADEVTKDYIDPSTR